MWPKEADRCALSIQSGPRKAVSATKGAYLEDGFCLPFDFWLDWPKEGSRASRGPYGPRRTIGAPRIVIEHS